MTMLVSIFGMAGRFAGDLLTTALGWATSRLFGRVPRRQQIFVIVMMALSFVWLLALLAVLLPAVASFLLAATPHPPSIDQARLDTVLLAAVLALPIAVGGAGILATSPRNRPKGLTVGGEIMRGYLLAPVISGLLLFLAGVGIVRKLRSLRHGWSDVHVPIVVKRHGYDEVVRAVQDALTEADLETIGYEAPRLLMMPGRVLEAVGGRRRDRDAHERLIELRSRTLRVGIYPSDIAISGTTRDRIRARAAILSRLSTAAAYLTTSAEAQAIEDELAEIAQRRRRNRAPAAVARAFEPIDVKLSTLAIPTDEWDTLYRIRLQIERDLLEGVEAREPAGA